MEVVVKYFITILLKSWKDKVTCTATLIIGVADDDVEIEGDTHQSNLDRKNKVLKLRINRGKLDKEDYEVRGKKNRTSYDVNVHFKEALVFSLYPFTIHSLICEIELSGSKYDICIPGESSKEEERELFEKYAQANLLQIKDEIFSPNCGNGVLRNSQAVYIDKDPLAKRENENQEYYHPRMYIRFLRKDDALRKVTSFLMKYLALYGVIVYCRYNDGTHSGADNTEKNHFQAIVVTALTSVITAVSTMVDDTKGHEIYVFSFGIILMAFTVVSYDQVWTILLPALIILYPLYSLIYYCYWIKEYTKEEDQKDQVFASISSTDKIEFKESVKNVKRAQLSRDATDRLLQGSSKNNCLLLKQPSIWSLIGKHGIKPLLPTFRRPSSSSCGNNISQNSNQQHMSFCSWLCPVIVVCSTLYVIMLFLATAGKAIREDL